MPKKYEYLHYTDVILKQNESVKHGDNKQKRKFGFLSRLFLSGLIFLVLFGASRLELPGIDGFNKFVKTALKTDVIAFVNSAAGKEDSSNKSDDYGKSELIDSIFDYINSNKEKA